MNYIELHRHHPAAFRLGNVTCSREPLVWTDSRDKWPYVHLTKHRLQQKCSFTSVGTSEGDHWRPDKPQLTGPPLPGSPHHRQCVSDLTANGLWCCSKHTKSFSCHGDDAVGGLIEEPAGADAASVVTMRRARTSLFTSNTALREATAKLFFKVQTDIPTCENLLWVSNTIDANYFSNIFKLHQSRPWFSLVPDISSTTHHMAASRFVSQQVGENVSNEHVFSSSTQLLNKR